MTIEELQTANDLPICEAIPLLFDFCYENGLEEYTSCYIAEEDIDDVVNSRLSSGCWQGVACLLNDINYLNDDYYLLDGYENLKSIRREDIICTVEEITNEWRRQHEER